MRNDAKKLFKRILVSILFIVIVTFAFFNSKDLIFGVKIKNVDLPPYMTVSGSILKVTGTAKNAVKLTLNGREISIDQAGNFDETIILSLGYNVVAIKAEDKFGHIDEKNYKVMYVADASAAQ